jgi:hypothetical protein
VANDPHRRQDEEPQSAFGLPIADIGPHSRQDEEPQRIAGFPIDSIGPTPADLEWLRSLAHPIRMYKRWARRRRLGFYATDEDESQVR